MSLWFTGSLKLDGQSETDVVAIDSVSMAPEMQRALTRSASGLDPEFISLMRTMPMLRCTTRQVAAVEDIELLTASLHLRRVGTDGLPSSDWVSLASGTDLALVIPRTVTAGPEAPATLAFDVAFLSTDGATAAVTVGTTAGVTTAEAAQHVISGAGVQNVTVEHGYTIDFRNYGALYPTSFFVRERNASITVVHEDHAQITAALVNAGSDAVLSATLAAIADGGVRGSTKTYSVTGHKHISPLNGGRPGTVSVRCDAANGAGLTIS